MPERERVGGWPALRRHNHAGGCPILRVLFAKGGPEV
jgi:hypothetical protein